MPSSRWLVPVAAAAGQSSRQPVPLPLGCQNARPGGALNATDALRDRPVLPTDKGFGIIAAGGAASARVIAERGPHAPGPEFTMPLLVLRDSAIEHNLRAMADWCARAGVLIAPHGKTTMAPQLFARQLAAGAWGITAATISQAQVYRAFGIARILIANELTDPAGIGWLAAELTADPSWECLAYADSYAGVRLLAETLRAHGAGRPLGVLVELGFPGGRTGCRTVADALDVAAAVRAADGLVLAGVAGYEGGLGADTGAETLTRVAAFCADLRELAGRLPGEPPPPAGPEGGPVPRPSWIVSAGGSAYFDIVASELTARETGAHPLTVVLRSGCYVTHDHGTYAMLSPAAGRGGPALVPALELWAPVLSCPEPGVAIVCAGRRDASFDQGLPVPLRVRPVSGGRPAGGERHPRAVPVPPGQLVVTRLDDQHGYLHGPAVANLAPGDLICLGISHPCSTFDKWRVIPVVDDGHRVIDVVHTFF